MAEKKSENAKAAAKKTAKKPNVFKRLAKYLGSCKSEIKKITWPTAKQTTKNFGIVIAMVAIVGVFIFALLIASVPETPSIKSFAILSASFCVPTVSS